VSDAVFLREDLGDPALGDLVVLAGDEGRHAVVVRRISVGEHIVVTDGRGRGVRGAVTAVDRATLTLTVAARLAAPPLPRRYVAVQALAKGDRGELACEMLTELGVAEIVPWAASRSVVRWAPDRQAKALARWRSTAREATKQARRLRVPAVAELARTADVVDRVTHADLAVVLHEQAAEPLGNLNLPPNGEVVIIIGPEGGISDEELAGFTAAGARAVTLGDGVLRTSTAGVVALAGLILR
jgi:16S rRNA (uracil1498-N3)-methyltransferase